MKQLASLQRGPFDCDSSLYPRGREREGIIPSKRENVTEREREARVSCLHAWMSPVIDARRAVTFIISLNQSSTVGWAMFYFRSFCSHDDDDEDDDVFSLLSIYLCSNLVFCVVLVDLFGCFLSLFFNFFLYVLNNVYNVVTFFCHRLLQLIYNCCC